MGAQLSPPNERNTFSLVKDPRRFLAGPIETIVYMSWLSVKSLDRL